MTIEEIHNCASETLSYFIHVMPDAPFAEGDIIIEFAKKKDMARRAIELCEKFVPEK